MNIQMRSIKFFWLIGILLVGLFKDVSAQAPQKFSYQAVIRNTSNAILANQSIGLRIRILQGSSTGTIVYAESHTPTTNSNGLVSIEVGSGAILNGNFATINWSTGTYYIRTDVDPAGGTSYSITSNTQLLSVPFALYAGNATSSNTVLNGTINPTNTIGNNGDFYINTASNQIFGPKSSGVWPSTGTSLIGPTGASGINGNTILNGSSNPSSGQGVNGDFFLNTTSKTLFGPKSAGVWPSSGTSLIGPTGATGANGTNGTNGINGLDGKTILNGTSNPLVGQGVNGDFFLNTTSKILFGPKSAGVWPSSGTSLIGPTGATGANGTNGTNGINGLDGKTILNGTSNPLVGQGVNGDFFLNTSTNVLFGPKAAGVWPSLGTSLIGPQGPSGGSNLTIRNGITKSTDTIELGGRLMKPTSLSQDGFSFQIKDIDSNATILEISQTAFSPLVNLSATPATQTFTSIASTKIHSVKIRVTATSGSSISLAIKNSGGSTLYSGTQNFSALFDNWQTFNVNSNVVQSVGEILTLSVTGTAGTTWYYSSGNPYAGGQSSVNPNRDFAFETIVFTDVPLLYLANKKVGIGTTNPSADLDVAGTIRTSQFQMTTGASNNRVLMCDANGIGSWSTISSLSSTSLNTAYNYGGAGNGRVINADHGPVEIEGSDGLLIRKIGFASTPEVISGPGERMFYCPEVPAFRCGEVSGSHWDLDSLGANSAAFGLDTRATGNQSFASGQNSLASGSNSFAIGSSWAQGSNSFAQGGGSKANGISSASFGYSSIASGTYSFATSKGTEAAGGSSSTFGNGTISNGFASTVLGVFNDTIIAKQANFETSETPLFIIGNGTSSLRKNAMMVRKDGRVGIGTSSPLAQLHVADSSVVFTSSGAIYPNTVQTPINGAGRRMLWFVARGAFRAGEVSGDNWNKDSIGIYSTAFGYNSKAKGHYALAAGDSASAEGGASIAFGNRCLANATGSVAIGGWTEATGNYATAMGSRTRAKGWYSTALGFQTTSNAATSLVIGQYNDTIVATETAPQASSPLFIVGNGSSLNRSNAMIVRYDGRVGIGTNAPLYQLELSTNSAAKPTSSSWTISSDARLKTVEGPYSKGLSDILKLNTIRYHYKEGNARRLPTNEAGYGFIAQELQEVFPEAVKENEDGYLSVDFHPVLVAYINAFKDQQAQINELKSSIGQLQVMINELKEKNETK
ncbi:MAG: tail fiber domain-containing protein [Bacteroidetes bacterium]|nr:tail fiber domain-containing protein [Bacteroidota bacterium]